MIEEQFNPDSSVEELREVRIDIPTIGPQQVTVEIIDGMAVAGGDMVLGPAEEFTDIETVGRPEEIVDSVAKSAESALWPDGRVPYEIHSGLPNRDRVVDAIEHWEDNTPLSFVRRTSQNDYIQFFQGNGCWSRVGRQGGRQRISLAAGCGTGAAIHEIAHAVGFWHAQSRSDRDVYVSINWENITEGKEHNFAKHEDANDIGRYDYGAIMHYGAYAFSKNGQKTIEAPEPIGQRNGLSERERDAVFRLYGPTDAGFIDGVDDTWQRFEFDRHISPDPVVIPGIQTYNGSDPAGVRLRNLGNSGELVIEEEQSVDNETRHLPEEVGFFAVEDGLIVDEDAEPIGRASSFRRSQDGPADWHPVMFDPGNQIGFTNPVVFMQIQSYNGSDPAHIRVRDVDSWWDSWFRFQIEEWGYLNKTHNEEQIGLVVLEAGTHTLRDGTQLEVGTVEGTDTWQSVPTSARTDPTVLSQCQSYNGHHEVVTRHRNVDRSGFDLRLQEEEGRDGSHTTETIGYLSVSPPPEFEFGIATNEATHKWSQLDYESNFRSVPATVASITTFNGADTAGVRMRKPGDREIDLRIEEEKSADSETAHVAESVGYITAPEGPIVPDGSGRIGEAGIVTQKQTAGSEWHTISFDGDYCGGAVAFAQVMSERGEQPAHTRLRNVGSTALEFQIEEWDYLNQSHNAETIGYIVLEPGVHQLPGDRLLEVGTTRTNHDWTSVSLDPRLRSGSDTDATVVTRAQSYNGPQAVVTRHRNVSPSGFDVRLQEEESNDGIHKTETVGYCAAVYES